MLLNDMLFFYMHMCGILFDCMMLFDMLLVGMCWLL